MTYSKLKMNINHSMSLHCLKVKCNEIWTIFLYLKNLYRKVICTNIKKNQLFEISFVRTVAINTRKSDDFRELHENEPEMAAKPDNCMW